MTSAREILQDAFGRVHELVPEAVGGLTAEQLLWRPDAEANHVAWLVWHLSRVQDDHVAGVAGAEQAWTAQGWSSRFGLPYPDDAIGYGQSSDEVGAFVLADPGLLTGYHEAVHELTRSVLDRLSDEGLSRVLDDSWDPPVTVGVRLVSVVNDIGQHVGQASYVRGLIERRA
jgi:hypothetical protein